MGGNLISAWRENVVGASYIAAHGVSHVGSVSETCKAIALIPEDWADVNHPDCALMDGHLSRGFNVSF